MYTGNYQIILQGLISCFNTLQSLQGHYRVELTYREIPVVITGNGFAVHPLFIASSLYCTFSSLHCIFIKLNPNCIVSSASSLYCILFPLYLLSIASPMQHLFNASSLQCILSPLHLLFIAASLGLNFIASQSHITSF